MIARGTCEAAFAAAVARCDPARLVREALDRRPIKAPIIGLAVGKAAMAMARGAGVVARGLCITNVLDREPLPPRWQVLLASHPLPDDTSVAAGRAALALVETAADTDTILALISGGASALLEVPESGVTLDELRRRTRETMASGASIHELNRVRTALSAVKGGKLAGRARGSVVTLAISDVVGDDPSVIGSGPTVRAGVAGDRVEVIGPLALFGQAIADALTAHGITATLDDTPLTGDVLDVAAALAARVDGPRVAWGEPTVRLPPDPGKGGRATQLALALAQQLRGTARSAFVGASDGSDGHSGAAGAYVDGTTWEAMAAAGVDPDAELARCNAAPALAAVGALFTAAPTGINHADVVILG